AGSAGCALAGRLSENPNTRVLLLEAGGRDWHPFIHMPAGLSRLVGVDTVNWAFETEPEPELHGRKLFWPRGRVLGGSSSINAMCYCRGHRKDYDGWRAAGNPGWGFADVLPYFIKSEDQQNGASEFHGAGGPLSVQNLRHTNPLSATFIEAAEQAGYQRNDDFNGAHQRGFGYYQVTQRDGRRCSSAVAYLRPAMDRPNLEVRTHALVEKIHLHQQRAEAVSYRWKGKTTRSEAGQIILAGGAIGSPHMLMLSGIGPAAHLHSLGIPVHHDLPGVGQNLQDHLDICTLVRSETQTTYDQLSDIAVGLRYLFDRKGPGSSNIAEAGGFVVSKHAPDDRPDIQVHFVPALLDDHGRNKLPGHGLTIHACALRPESRGEIRLKSADPAAAPAMQANYLSTEYDRKMMLECAKLARQIFAQPAFADAVGEELLPGKAQQSDAELLEFIRTKAESIYHPIGTCKMGHDDMAVVDHKLQVHGLTGLAVVDASIMPTLVSGNTNAPTIMIAEKYAAQAMAG
ncbi:MAG TPA: choline dehydrogenase, partial [Xanthomonadales bacterium]|nr:choline dehydrogenase [Xanthomonadales bacterium]